MVTQITHDKRDNYTIITVQSAVSNSINMNHALIVPMIGVIILSTFVIGYMIGGNLKKD